MLKPLDPKKLMHKPNEGIEKGHSKPIVIKEKHAELDFVFLKLLNIVERKTLILEGEKPFK